MKRSTALIITITPIPRETFTDAVAFLRLYSLWVVDSGTTEFEMVWRSPRPSQNAKSYDVWQHHINGSYTLRHSGLLPAQIIELAKKPK